VKRTKNGFGDYLQELRSAAGFSLRDLSAATGISLSRLWAYEHGTSPKLESLAALSRAFDMPLHCAPAKVSMTVKKKRRPPLPKLTKAKPELSPKLSRTEEDLLWQMAHGYQLETSSRWDNPILRNLKDNTELRAIAKRGTIEALQKRGLIAVAKDGGVVNPTVWRLNLRRS
jgi:transcriptional regulator with XRE-family HTH domain